MTLPLLLGDFIEIFEFFFSDKELEDSLSSDENEESDQLRVINRVEFKDQFETKLKGVIRYVFL